MGNNRFRVKRRTIGMRKNRWTRTLFKTMTVENKIAKRAKLAIRVVSQEMTNIINAPIKIAMIPIRNDDSSGFLSKAMAAGIVSQNNLNEVKIPKKIAGNR